MNKIIFTYVGTLYGNIIDAIDKRSIEIKCTTFALNIGINFV